MPIAISPDMLVAFKDEIAQCDAVLDSAAGGATAGKRSMTNTLVKENEDQVSKILDQFEQLFSNPETTEDMVVGIYSGVVKGLNEKYDGVIDKYFDARKAEVEANSVKYTPEELAAAANTRKELVTKFKGLKSVLEMLGEDVDGIKDPSRRTGAKGKRGPRAISLYTWSVDGVRQSEEADSLAGVANANGYESAKELRDAMRKGTILEDGTVVEGSPIDLKTPPELVEFKLKNGKLLTGKKPASASEEPEEDEDEDEDSEEAETSDE